jgi:hypothetical protein
MIEFGVRVHRPPYRAFRLGSRSSRAERRPRSGPAPRGGGGCLDRRYRESGVHFLALMSSLRASDRSGSEYSLTTRTRPAWARTVCSKGGSRASVRRAIRQSWYRPRSGCLGRRPERVAATPLPFARTVGDHSAVEAPMQGPTRIKGLPASFVGVPPPIDRPDVSCANYLQAFSGTTDITRMVASDRAERESLPVWAPEAHFDPSEAELTASAQRRYRSGHLPSLRTVPRRHSVGSTDNPRACGTNDGIPVVVSQPGSRRFQLGRASPRPTICSQQVKVAGTVVCEVPGAYA